MVLPIAWQYPEDTVARIRYNGKIYKTNDFKETQWVQLQTFKTIDNNKGLIEVYYTKEFPYEVERTILKRRKKFN